MSENNKICRNCDYYNDKTRVCRRYAPRPLSDNGKSIPLGNWPKVLEDDYCGEFNNAFKEAKDGY